MSGAPTLAELGAMDRARLLDVWQNVFGTAPPKGMSQSLMRRYLAHELQARGQRRAVDRVKKQVLRLTKSGAPAPSPGLRSGARLVREWQGVAHTVEVVEGGFVWRGGRYRSLSAIASAITGTRWSGPRFFGLVNRAR